jgi:hypothetical protein
MTNDFTAPSSGGASVAIDRGHDAALDQNRFGFGANWRQFLALLDEQAVQSMKTLLREDTLLGKSFLDIGSGSGLFSLAARHLGARVHSFDYDVDSVGCTTELRRRFYPDDPNWTVEQGSILSPPHRRYVESARARASDDETGRLALRGAV